MPNKPKNAGNEIFQIKVTLWGTQIWRRLLVPSDLTLGNLHHVLQKAMGWYNDHMHEFKARGRSYGARNPLGDPVDREDEEREDQESESDVELHQVFGRVGAKVVYTYDFGDNWEHEVVLEKRLPADPKMKYPVCTGGELAGPPEDCGGLGGYFDLVQAMKNPRHPRRKELMEWLGVEFAPQEFSIDKVNRVLHGRGRRV